MPFNDLDIHYMKKALEQSIKAMDKKEVPIGSVIVHHNTIIGKGYNCVEQTKDATAHAEIISIGSASQTINNWRLKNCTLYVTLEPCPMCMGAIINSRISKIIYGTKDPRLGACGSACDLKSPNLLNHNLEIISGVLQDDCRDILLLFFKELRKQRRTH